MFCSYESLFILRDRFKLYFFERAVEYPQVKDQLDMIYHAIDKNKLDKTSDFYKEIKKVKDALPKPSE